MEKIANEIMVYGIVQGVGFRFQTLQAADNFNISGFVRNERDGSVYIFAEAAKENMNAFINWCKNGPLYARVSKVNVVATEPKGLSGFEIKRT
ncbi:MAG: acylphosphatase [Chlorobi bacterium]|nr:acylphosphatase [Chlorobiota bacterium]